jgi:hypothetical protein
LFFAVQFISALTALDAVLCQKDVSENNPAKEVVKHRLNIDALDGVLLTVAITNAGRELN